MRLKSLTSILNSNELPKPLSKPAHCTFFPRRHTAVSLLCSLHFYGNFLTQLTNLCWINKTGRKTAFDALPQTVFFLQYLKLRVVSKYDIMASETYEKNSLFFLCILNLSMTIINLGFPQKMIFFFTPYFFTCCF